MTLEASEVISFFVALAGLVYVAFYVWRRHEKVKSRKRKRHKLPGTMVLMFLALTLIFVNRLATNVEELILDYRNAINLVEHFSVLGIALVGVVFVATMGKTKK